MLPLKPLQTSFGSPVMLWSITTLTVAIHIQTIRFIIQTDDILFVDIRWSNIISFEFVSNTHEIISGLRFRNGGFTDLPFDGAISFAFHPSDTRDLYPRSVVLNV